MKFHRCRLSRMTPVRGGTLEADNLRDAFGFDVVRREPSLAG